MSAGDCRDWTARLTTTPCVLPRKNLAPRGYEGYHGVGTRIDSLARRAGGVLASTRMTMSSATETLKARQPRQGLPPAHPALLLVRREPDAAGLDAAIAFAHALQPPGAAGLDAVI